MRDILIVIAPNDFQDEEFFESKDVFMDNDFVVEVASLERGRSVGASGGEVDIDVTIEEVEVELFDAVVFIGGPGMEQLVEEPRLINLANDFFIRQKLCAAICVAPSILANAGILDGKLATAQEGERGTLENEGATYTGDDVTADGLVVTARRSEAAEEFALKIIEVLTEL